MLVEEKIMEVLEAYDLTNSFRSTAACVGWVITRFAAMSQRGQRGWT